MAHPKKSQEPAKGVPVWQKVRRLAAVLLIGGTIGVALVAGGIAVKGNWDWNRVRADLDARGEKLSLPGLAPSPVPAADNFFADPLWEETVANPAGPVRLDGIFPPLTAEEAETLKARFPAAAAELTPGPRQPAAQKILQQARDRTLTKDEATLLLELTDSGNDLAGQLAVLAQRSGSRYPLRYEDGSLMKKPAVAHLMRFAKYLSMRARAHLVLGDAEKALDETLLIFRVARTFETEPFLISLLVALSLDAMALDLVEQGLPQWQENDLRRLEQALAKIHATRDLATTLRGERAMVGEVMEKIRQSPETLVASAFAWQESSKTPSLGHVALGVLYSALFLSGDQAFLYATLQSWIDAVEADPELLGPQVLAGTKAHTSRMLDRPVGRLRHVMSALALAGLEGAFQRVAYVQNRVRQARIACALRRYILASGQLPATLDSLVPDFLEKMPADIIDGRPMSYRVEANGSYKLWSVGWDGTDGGGAEADAKREKAKAPDWVWKG